MSERAALSPREVSERWGCDTDSVYSLIASGALLAFTISPPGARRPSYRIALDVLAAYEQGKPASPPGRPRRPKRREQRPADYIEYV